MDHILDIGSDHDLKAMMTELDLAFNPVLWTAMTW